MGHERTGRARLRTDGIDDVEELHVAIALPCEPLPAHARRELDHPPGLRALGEAVRALDDALAGLLAEDVAHRHPELRDDRVERAHRGIDPVELDLGHETRRDTDPASKLTQPDAEALSLRAKPVPDLRGIERCRGRRLAHRRRSLISAAIRPGPGRNACSSGGLYGIGVSGVAMRHASSRWPSPCSTTEASTSPAHPPVSGPSSTTTIRFVFRTDATTVSRSNGLSVRRSITSTEIPSFSSSSAASMASWTPFIAVASVMSLPSR